METVAQARAADIVHDVPFTWNELALAEFDDELLPEPGRADSREADPTAAQLADAERAIHKLHNQTGHPGPRALKTLLQRRGTPAWVIKLVDHIECAPCERFRKRQPMPVASEQPRTPWTTCKSTASTGYTQ